MRRSRAGWRGRALGWGIALAFVLGSVEGRAAGQAGPGRPREPGARPESGATEDPAELVDALLSGLLGFTEASEAELQAEVAEVGGVPFKKAVPLAYMDRAELKRYVADLIDSEYPAEDGEADARTLIAFDLLPPGTDLRALRARVLEENVVGFYDERKDRRRLYVVSQEQKLSPMNQLVLSHELRHALQDQYMDIDGLLDPRISDYDDRSLALLSLLEGDATFVMERFLLRRLPAGVGDGEGSGMFGLQAMPGAAAVPGAPPVVRDQLVLPYFAGRDFVKALFAQAGWGAVRAAWARPPVSTEQVLHPHKYLAGERPRPVEVPDRPKGTRVLREGVLGEALLRTWLGEGQEEAAAGWGGDTFRSWDQAGRTLLHWSSDWDTASDAREFLAAAEGRLVKACGSPGVRAGALVFVKGRWSFALRARGGRVDLLSSDAPEGLDSLLNER